MAKIVSEHADVVLNIARNSNNIDLVHTRPYNPTVSELFERLSKPKIDTITLAEYLDLSPKERNKHKSSAGWITGGRVRKNYRCKKHMGKIRQLMLDIDGATPELIEEIISGDTAFSKFEWFMHTTRSHDPAKPRVRIYVPLRTAVPLDIFEAFARITCTLLATDAQAVMDAVDPASFSVAQLMYLPTISRDQEFKKYHNKGELLDYQDILDQYDGDYTNFATLPHSSKRDKKHRTHMPDGSYKDPRDKEGVVGAFCRKWNIEQAMREFIPDVYEQDIGGDSSRYRYTGSDSMGGAVVLDDGQYLYSHHINADPCGGESVNAFDMVRLHEFGELDDDTDPETKMTKLPSYQAMIEMLMEIPEFRDQLAEDRVALDESIIDAFKELDIEEKEDEDKKIPAVMRWMNERHAVVVNDGNTIILNFKNAEGHLTYSTAQDLHMLYANRTATLKTGKLMTYDRYWMEHPKRRQYIGVDFNPNGVPDGWLNTYPGFPLAPRAGGNFKRIRWHLKHVICNGDKVLFKALIQWLAHMMQKPGEKPGFAVVLISEGKGTGKDTVGHIVHQMLGRMWTQVLTPRQLLGNFNAHLSDCLFIQVSEAIYPKDKSAQGMLQNLITEPFLPIERKGKDIMRVSSFQRIMITSNHHHVVPASADERRYFVLTVSDRKKQNADYFDALYAEIEDVKSIQAFIDYLMHVDISDFDPRNPPKTNALTEQKLANLTGVAEWWYYRLQVGHIPGFSKSGSGDGGCWDEPDMSEWQEGSISGKKQALYDDYCDRNRRRRYDGDPVTPAIFWREMKKMMPEIKTGTARQGKTFYKKATIEGLDTCRAAFAKFIGGSVAWEGEPMPCREIDLEDLI